MTDRTIDLLESIADSLEVPPSYYEKATDRYHSLGEWLHRDDSKVAAFDPRVYLQGAFRYGTVNWSLLGTEKYDLDLVCEVNLDKSDVTQDKLKHLIGDEIKAYAKRYGIKAPTVERNRCWRLDYADDVSFHMDILPCVPEAQDIIHTICSQRVPVHLALKSVAITDKQHPQYRQITRNWPCSNPKGLGDWFEEQARPMALSRMAQLVRDKAYASIDQVPSYEWKTPLQRSIQVLKRHRDVMFKDNPQLAPISMIITVLAARAYRGEARLQDAIEGIVNRMPLFVSDSKPRIPNPVNPGEDFADRWAGKPLREENFWAWHDAVKADLAKLPEILERGTLAADVRRLFRIDLTEEQLKHLEVTAATFIPATPKVSPVTHISASPRPWQRDG